MVDEKMSEWIAEVKLLTPISENSVKEVDGIKFDVEVLAQGSGVVLKGFSITIPPTTPDDAFLYAQEKANNIFDYLSSIHRYNIVGYLNNIIENKPGGELKVSILPASIDMILHACLDVDFGMIRGVLENKDVKLSRQLAHYSMGLKSEYIPIKVQQFFQVAEDEYNEKHPFITEYRWVRHIVSHPELNKSKEARKKAEDCFGKNYVDLSNPRDMDKLKKALVPIKAEAEKIIDGKIQMPEKQAITDI